MVKLVFKKPKLVSPAFHLQGVGWISHKKAAFFGLIGFMKLYYMTLWLFWARRQKVKSAEQLEEEGHKYIVSFEETRK